MMSYVRRALLGALAISGVGFFGFAQEGCSSSSTASCDPAQCAAGNECLSDGKETKCRLLCTTHSVCPNNYRCNGASPKSFCAPDAIQFGPSEAGQWGAPCNPAGGFAENPDCDFNQNFWCFGKNPTDAKSFCTQYDCTSDDECRGGWYCGEVNSTPSVYDVKPTWNQTRRVCLPRNECAPCASNMDCGSPGGRAHYCVTGNDGAKFCAPDCSSDGCAKYSECKENADAPVNVCVPRAGTCKGDGSICSPCRSDTDCTNGVCASSAYSGERFCTDKATSPTCGAGACPNKPAAAPAGPPIVGVGCVTRDSEDSPKGQCVGLVQFGVDNDNKPVNLPGCWTPSQN